MTRQSYANWTFETFKEEMKSRGITRRRDLHQKFPGLYSKANSEGWLEYLPNARTNRDYTGWTIDTFVEEVKRLGIRTRTELQDHGLYHKAVREDWIKAIPSLRQDYQHWTEKKFKAEMKRLGITSRKELEDKNPGLCQKARLMGWIEHIPSSFRNYDGWTAQTYAAAVKKTGATNRRDLAQKEPGLYFQGLKQHWLDAAFGPKTRREYHAWDVTRFQEEVARLKVKNGYQLQRKDPGLFQKAAKMGWLDVAFPNKKQFRDYSGWDAERFRQEVQMRGFTTRFEIIKQDSGLYTKALHMGWLDIVFPKKQASLDELLSDYAGAE